MIIHQTGQYNLDVTEPLDLTIIQLNGEDIQVNLNFTEPDIQATIRSLTIGHDDQKSNLVVNLRHQAPRTSATFDGRALMQQSSQLAFRGLIKIEPTAKDTESYLTHRSLLQDGARVSPIPALEIENNEVQASHAVAVAQLDEDALFYLQSRGLSAPEATNLLTTAFIADVTDHLETSWHQKITRIIR
jgi:Fe-S cluster assembly protein SufD